MPKFTIKQRKKYSPEAMLSAYESVKDGMMSIKKASEIYGVPRTTLNDKVLGRVPYHDAKPGPPTVLNVAEENTLVRYINLMAEIGYPLTRDEFLREVKKVLDRDGRSNPFRNNLPGKGWYYLFKARHPELTERIPQALGRQRSNISYEMVSAWYDSLNNYLAREVPEWKDIINNPRRIFNADESGFPLCIKSKKVLTSRSTPHVYQVVNGTKIQITVMACMNALGDYLPPFVIYQGQRLRDCGIGGFLEAIYGVSENGWMTSDLFYQFLTVLVDFIEDKKIPRPIILFVDGHSTHMSLQTAEYCAEKQIILYCLLENASHILQACDVGLFSPLKTSWQKNVKEWQMDHINQNLTKSVFPEVFKKAWNATATLQNSTQGFKRSGLFPLSIEGIDKSKLAPSKLNSSKITVLSQATKPISDQSTADQLSPRQITVPDPSSIGSSVSGLAPVSQVEPLVQPLAATKANKESLMEAALPNEVRKITVVAEIHDSPTSSHTGCSMKQHRSKVEVSKAFNILRVPEARPQRTTIRSTLPKALSGKEALAIFRGREAKKQQELEEKEQRKKEKERKRQEKSELEARKREERETKKIEREKRQKEKSKFLELRREERARKRKSKANPDESRKRQRIQ